MKHSKEKKYKTQTGKQRKKEGDMLEGKGTENIRPDLRSTEV